MNHSNFNFYNAFDFDDDTSVFAFQVATPVVAEEESNIQGRRQGIVALFFVTILSIVIERQVS
jgi:hypothetical protein